jgi:Uma2 family endonuclease
MSAVSTALMTAEEFFEWANRPENADTVYELEDGKVVPMPSPGELHGTICWLLTHLLSTYVFRRGAGQICTNDTGLIVRRGPDSVRGPDVVLFLEPRAVSQLNRGHIDRVPALVVEVLSPTDRFSQTLRRVDQYTARGVPLVWVVDPDERAVHVFRPGELRHRLEETDTLTGYDVLPDFSCAVAALFTLPGQPPNSPPTA